MRPDLPRLVVVFWSLGCVLALAGCRLDMHDQPRYQPLAASDFYRDGTTFRLPIEGTVARGQLREDELLYTGKQNGVAVDLFPFEVTEAVMRRGQEEFGAFCTPCHGRLGDGDGMIVRRGFQRPPTLHSDRLRDMPAGQIFDVISNGFGAMPDYAALVSVEDRWAVVAYLRALQLSQHARVAELAERDRAAIAATEPSR